LNHPQSAQRAEVKTSSRGPTRAVFLDRDGVVIPDDGAVLDPADVRVLDGVGPALAALKSAGFLLVLVTNQAAVARGWLTEVRLAEVHDELNRQLLVAGGPALDAIYFCPHHPHANVPAYRVACDCRKPRAGMLTRAAREHALNLPACVMVGDRITDILAGASAGCRTVLIEGPQSAAPLIVTADPIDHSIRPDHTCLSLAEAARWILEAP
jgi:D-glycero-D-manno-heptose 1,7-bisphosphate phosphatase